MEQAKAPGLKWRTRKGGERVPYWVASSTAVRAGYTPKTVRLTGLEDSPRDIAGRCERLQSEMLMWLSGRSSYRPLFDGTIRSLLDIYQTDPESPYRKLKPSSRYPYDVYASKLRGHIGERRIDAIDRRDVDRWFAVWCGSSEAPTLAAARMAVTVLKSALTFGKGCRLAGCADLKSILGDMRFSGLKPRAIAPTAEQVIAARKAARESGAPRRALAYALQFETTLRQWDVVGQWLPLSDPRPSSLLAYGEKWIGLTWAKIDQDLILRLTPTKTEDTSEARVAIDLKECPMVLEELEAIPLERRTGPLIPNERTGLPYRHDTLRQAWRHDATAAGLPRAMWNRDLRAGGVTEGGQAGASLEDRAKLAGHSKPKITAEVYDRDSLEAARRVARARAKHRTAKDGT